METTAIVQFIGIVLFSSYVPNDPGVHAILPRIGSTPTSISFITGIEEHRAVILYRKEDLLEKSTTWKAIPADNKDWESLELNGEQVQFFTDADNGYPAVPAELPRSGTCDKLAVPPTLTPNFLPSTSYRGAIAVFDIRGGRLDSCESKGPRADTRLFLRTENVLIISAKRPGEPAKTITLDQDAVVFVANVPPAYLGETSNPQHNHALSQAHWGAYNSMLGGTCSARPVHPTLVTPCDDPKVLTTASYKKARTYPPSKGLGVILDPQCSNSQWP